MNLKAKKKLEKTALFDTQENILSLAYENHFRYSIQNMS